MCNLWEISSNVYICSPRMSGVKEWAENTFGKKVAKLFWRKYETTYPRNIDNSKRTSKNKSTQICITIKLMKVKDKQVFLKQQNRKDTIHLMEQVKQWKASHWKTIKLKNNRTKSLMCWLAISTIKNQKERERGKPVRIKFYIQ